MHKKEVGPHNYAKNMHLSSCSQYFSFLIFITILVLQCHSQLQKLELPTKIFEIKKSDQEIPIILLSDIFPQFQSISLILDSGSQQFVLFDNQCSSCINTFSACPHIKTFNNQSLITYLLTKFKGDFSYLTLGDELRIRFFCVLEVDQNFNFLESNGILGLRPDLIKKDGQDFKQGNGLKIWRRIIHNIYSSEFQQISKKAHQITFQMLKYSILYTDYRTKLILGSLPSYFSQSFITQYSLKQKTYANKFYFFDQNRSNNKNQNLFTRQYVVHFDTGSSVIVLPGQIFNNLFKQISQEISNQCFIKNKIINCPKKSIEKFIENDFKLAFSLHQVDNSQQKQFEISLENLIGDTDQSNEKMFSFKIYGNQQTQKQQEIIILGVPFFKQYLLQFDIPYQIQDKSNSIQSQISIQTNQQVLYLLKIYSLQTNSKEEFISTYEHLLKKQTKNIKILLLTYFIFVIIISGLTIKIYWFTYHFIHGKKSIV